MRPSSVTAYAVPPSPQGEGLERILRLASLAQNDRYGDVILSRRRRISGVIGWEILRCAQNDRISGVILSRRRRISGVGGCEDSSLRSE